MLPPMLPKESIAESHWNCTSEDEWRDQYRGDRQVETILQTGTKNAAEVWRATHNALAKQLHLHQSQRWWDLSDGWWSEKFVTAAKGNSWHCGPKVAFIKWEPKNSTNCIAVARHPTKQCRIWWQRSISCIKKLVWRGGVWFSLVFATAEGHWNEAENR